MLALPGRTQREQAGLRQPAWPLADTELVASMALTSAAQADTPSLCSPAVEDLGIFTSGGTPPSEGEKQPPLFKWGSSGKKTDFLKKITRRCMCRGGMPRGAVLTVH
ncbi:hypothetical protein LDENG_00044090 [Lucifuga dentata]|nr:hypothetical protein LDENG_00044090 [Lucifuga dentata]